MASAIELPLLHIEASDVLQLASASELGDDGVRHLCASVGERWMEPGHPASPAC